MHTFWFPVVGALFGLAVAGCDRGSAPAADSSAAVPPPPAASAEDASSLPAQPADNTPAGTTPADSTEGALVVATEGAAGPYLANSAGSALYMLEGNEDGTGCSTEPCLAAWPPMLASAAVPSANAGLQPALVGQIGRVDGSTQMTYNGHPLHRYAADTGVGSTAGHGVEDKWGKWHLVAPQGSAVEAVAE